MLELAVFAFLEKASLKMRFDSKIYVFLSNCICAKLADTVKQSLFELVVFLFLLKLEFLYLRQRRVIMSDKNKPEDSSLSNLYENEQLTFDHLKSLTKSPKMLDALEKAEGLSQYNDPVLLIGGTGVGKNMTAQAMHNSKEKKKKFYEINCAGIPENLLEAELFGSTKGAFTGATDKPGKVEEANQGTLFLDEIGEFSTVLQAKILRFIERKKFSRLGENQVRTADVYIICATNKSIEELQDNRLFRQDLFHRMLDFIEIPRLKDRPEDFELLVKYFFGHAAKEIKLNEQITVWNDKLITELKKYTWPGNVRQLKHVIKLGLYYSIIESKKQEAKKRNIDWRIIKTEDLNTKVILNLRYLEQHLNQISSDNSCNKDLDEVVKEYILKVWRLKNHNVSEAADVLHIGKETLYRKLERYGVIQRDQKNT